MRNADLRAFVALGTNQPHGGVAGADLLSQALGAMEREGLHIERASHAWTSKAWPPSDQPDYVNAVAESTTDERDPTQIYVALMRIELAFGRARRERWAARTLDLDLIDAAGLVGEYGGIILPHPQMHERAFVLGPLAEIAPDWRHPILGVGIEELLAHAPIQDAEPLVSTPLHVAKSPDAD